MSTYHTPVLVDEVVTGLAIRAGERYIDATLGGGGHTWEIVKRGGIVLGIDADRDALTTAQKHLEFGCQAEQREENWTLVQGNFREIEEIAKTNGFTNVSGVLMDLGVSSYQLDTATKGFSYRFLDSTLDMRFDPEKGESAADVLKSATEEELYEIFTKFGEEERARSIAHALIRARKIKKLETVGDVVTSITSVVGVGSYANSTMSRIFQSLRIYTNDEFGALSEGLDGARSVLQSGGRLAVISFHSLEDRIVKQHMKHSGWKQITKKPLAATREEEMHNKRARSAKLRIVEKL